MASSESGAVASTGPVVFAYDGSELAALAIEQAGRQLAPGQAGIVVCVWHPADVGFTLPGEHHLDADQAFDVKAAAEEVAAHGAALAQAAGSRRRARRSGPRPPGKGSSRPPTSTTRASS